MVDRACAYHNVGFGEDISLEHCIRAHRNRAGDNPDDVLRKCATGEDYLDCSILDESS